MNGTEGPYYVFGGRGVYDIRHPYDVRRPYSFRALTPRHTG